LNIQLLQALAKRFKCKAGDESSGRIEGNKTFGHTKTFFGNVVLRCIAKGSEQMLQPPCSERNGRQIHVGCTRLLALNVLLYGIFHKYFFQLFMAQFTCVFSFAGVSNTVLITGSLYALQSITQSHRYGRALFLCVIPDPIVSAPINSPQAGKIKMKRIHQHILLAG
jgi:hypothetical protein